jgi:hypothetical protein
MKKFGTPIAAGPGTENENVGFAGEGTPPASRNGGNGGGGAPLPGWLLWPLPPPRPLPPPVPELLIEPEREPDPWVCVCEVDVGWFDWVDVVVGVVPGELEVPDVEGGVEVEPLGGGALLLGDEEVDVPEPPGTEGKFGVGTLGVGTLGVGTVGVGTAGVVTVGVGRGAGRFGVVTSSAEAGGRAVMPTTTSVVIAATTSVRLRNTAVNLLPKSCSSKW